MAVAGGATALAVVAAPAVSAVAMGCSNPNRTWPFRSSTATHGGTLGLPARDRWFGSDPKGVGGRGCANPPAPEPVAGPLTAGSLPSTARTSRTPRANGATRPKDVATPADKRKWAAHGSADGQSVHRTPMSFAHSSTAPSRSAEYRPIQPRRTGGGRPPMRRGFPSLRCLPSSRFRRNGRSKPRDDVTVQRPRIMPPQTVRPRHPPLNLYHSLGPRRRFI